MSWDNSGLETAASSVVFSSPILPGDLCHWWVLRYPIRLSDCSAQPMIDQLKFCHTYFIGHLWNGAQTANWPNHISDISTSSKSNTIGAMLRVQCKLSKNSSVSTFSCRYHHDHHYSCSINAAEEVPLHRLCLTKNLSKNFRNVRPNHIKNTIWRTQFVSSKDFILNLDILHLKAVTFSTMGLMFHIWYLWASVPVFFSSFVS